MPAESSSLCTPVLFPARPAADATTLVLLPSAGAALPRLGWLGTGATAGAAGDLRAVRGAGPTTPLLAEQSRGSFRRPGLRGHRLGAAGTAGGDWSTAFAVERVDVGESSVVIDAGDPAAGLGLHTEIETLPGGPLRIRHVVTNRADAAYVVDGLDVAVPAPDGTGELLDFTGRHERERVPQRHAVTDGLWLRENRRGRTALEAATVLVAGRSGFDFGHGELVGVHPAWSGNTLLWAERDPEGETTLGAGELLLPGEIVLQRDESYATPWVVVVAGGHGLDSVAAPLHRWQRTLPAHPGRQPVVLNVWEAVYFDHDLDRLTALADRAAAVGVERFVLDDGWFLGRRDDTAGLGDWWVDETVWPKGLHPLADHVRGLGMQFGLWFEPEMVNPDSVLYRDHPEWVLGAAGRVPLLSRNQVVLDLTNPEVSAYLLARMDAVLSEYPIDFVKWDHNRDLLEAAAADGRPAVHRQTLAFYALLDELRRRHPEVAWESCASGGGRIDLAVLERVQRVWTSDMTDALSRQAIQRWTGQLVAPEYLGAHVSAPVTHQSGRTLSLDFRAATALFGSFGIEWDLTEASADELEALHSWVRLYQEHRELLHTGRVVRVDSPDPAVWMHGVVAADGRSALFAHVQLDESESNRGVVLRVPGLEQTLRYAVGWVGPVDDASMSRSPQVDPAGPTGGAVVSGGVLGDVGVWLPRRRPETVLLMHVRAVPGEETSA